MKNNLMSRPWMPAMIVCIPMLLAAGCATPKSVRTLAERTSANAASLSAQLKNFGDAHTRLAELRAQTLASRFAALERHRRKHEHRKAGLRIAGDTDVLTTFAALIKESDQAAKSTEALKIQESNMRAELKKALGPVVAPAKELNDVAKRLEELAGEESLLKRAKELARFYKDVRDQVDTSLDKKKELTQAAEKSSSDREDAIVKTLKKLEE